MRTPSHNARLGSGTTITRRRFLGCASLAATSAIAPWIIPGAARGADGAVPPSERITVGIIGIGVMGGFGVMGSSGPRGGHLRFLAGQPAVQLLAVCDVDRERRETARAFVEESYASGRARGTFRGCSAYNDYREILARPDIDAVLISTPDHWHALQAIDAAKAGKDIYCEKPVCMTIREGRTLVETVRSHARVFQTGSQYRSISRIRRVCEFVRAGGLGRVKSVFTIWGRNGVPSDPALPAEPVPQGLDWDLWVGPAVWRPYNRRYHRNPPPGVVPWSFCDAFGLSAVTGYHSHAADVIQYALGMETSGPVEIIHPADGEFPTMTCRYANGTLLHHVDNWDMVKDVYGAVPSTAGLRGNFGGLFVGERGWLTSMSGVGSGRLEGSPETLFTEMELWSRQEALANNHHANWFDCIRTRAQPSSHEEIGHRSASVGLLVIAAHKLGRSLKWDPIKEAFVGDEAANRVLSRALREPWRV